MTTPIEVLREATKAVPAVKYALGIGGVLAAVALVYSFKIDSRVAFVGTIVVLVLMGVLVVFARMAALSSARLHYPVLVFTWFVLLLFMATAISLFTSVFFKAPVDLQYWITGGMTVTADLPLTADSGWRGGGSSPATYCGEQLAALKKQMPSRKIEIVDMKEDHKSEYTPFKRDYYRYQCWFRAT